MIPVFLNTEQAKFIDNYSIQKGIPSIVLMENAGRSVAEIIEKYVVNKSAKILILAGSGNNGGDGFVTARHLKLKHFSNIKVLLTSSPEKLQGDALINYQLLRYYNIPVETISDKNLRILEEELKDTDVIVDAIIGIGFKGELKEPVKKILKVCAKEKKGRNIFTVAIDLPTGIEVENPWKEYETILPADVVVTFGGMKLGLLDYPAKRYIKDVYVVDVSFIPEAYVNLSPRAYFVSYKHDSYPRIYKRCEEAHKGVYGHLGIIGGDKDGKLIGAVILAGLSANTTGVGLITAITPNKYTNQILKSFSPEIMGFPIEGDWQGLKEFIKGKTILFGNGLGKDVELWERYKEVLMEFEGNLVIDADGINMLATWDKGLLKEWLTARRRGNYWTIITPHIGEFSRLTGIPKERVKTEKINVVREFVEEYGVWVVLKDAVMFLFTPSGEIYINDGGVGGLAKGGSGDIFAGLVAGFTATGYPPEISVPVSMVLLTETARNLSNSISPHAISPMKIIEKLPEMIKIVEL